VSAEVTDLFCGAGGSSLGAELAGARLRLGLNHWPRAIETHATNFGHADHDCNDISSLSTARIRGYPDSDILLASPECTNHSLAKGGRRRKPQASSLFDDGPAGDQEAERSRATMWDVCRFAEAKLDAGRPYKAIVVENVPDAFWWGPGRRGHPSGDGTLFDAWLGAMRALGYEHEILWLNSMFAGPLTSGRAVPQSRDRMYVVFWLKGARRPDLRIRPLGWCPACGTLVEGLQSFKQVSLRKSGGRPWGRYGQQYVYSCPACAGTIFPGAVPAAEAIDWSLPIGRIGDRERRLEDSTRGRIRRGWQRVLAEPFELRVGATGNPRPQTLPLIRVAGPAGSAPAPDGRALVVAPMGEVAARPATGAPAPTQSTTTRPALVMANTENGVPRPLGREACQALRTGGGLSLVATGQADEAPRTGSSSTTAAARAGVRAALVMRNNEDRAGEQTTGAEEPIRTLTGRCHQSLVIPYHRTATGTAAGEAPAPTLSTRDRLALLVPDTPGPQAVGRVGAPAAGAPEGPAVPAISEEDIDDCLFRMFDLPEIARAMAMAEHVDGEADYQVLGNRRERMAQYGNAVTPPAMELIVGRLLEVID
jgi:DNA (cytosine-5)-methyltransferase 1